MAIIPRSVLLNDASRAALKSAKPKLEDYMFEVGRTFTSIVKQTAALTTSCKLPELGIPIEDILPQLPPVVTATWRIEAPHGGYWPPDLSWQRVRHQTTGLAIDNQPVEDVVFLVEGGFVSQIRYLFGGELLHTFQYQGTEKTVALAYTDIPMADQIVQFNKNGRTSGSGTFYILVDNSFGRHSRFDLSNVAWDNVVAAAAVSRPV